MFNLSAEKKASSNINFALAASLFLLSSCDKQVEAPAAQLPAVIVSSVTKTTINPSKDFVGRTQASEDAKIKSRVQGYLLNYHFKEGDMIKKGDLLFEIDPIDLKNIVDREAARLRQAKAAETLAIKNYGRGKELVPKGFISESDMDKLESAMLDAKANIAATNAALSSAQLNLDYTRITSPIDGKISNSNVSTGDLINTTQELTSVVQLDPIYVNVQLDENTFLSNRLRRQKLEQQNKQAPELSLSLRLPNGNTYSEDGILDYVDNRVDANTGTIRVRASFNNPNNVLLPGQYVTLIASSTETEMALLIPQSAVQQDQQGYFVLTVNEKNTVQKKVVQLANKIGIQWAVKSGLTEGQNVIVEGVLKVRPGIQVTTKEQTQTPFKL